MWVLSAVFCIATYLSYRRAGYTYLRLAVATLIAELVRQIANDLTIPYPEPAFYLLSSVATFAEALLFLGAVDASIPVFGTRFLLPWLVVGADIIYGARGGGPRQRWRNTRESAGT